MSAKTASPPQLTYAEQRRAYVVAVVDSAPPLTNEQRAALRELLRPVAVKR